MATPTVKSDFTGKKNFRQTIAQGFKALGGQEVPNYTLLFLDPTKRKQKGEFLTIVVPYIEVGRGSTCIVQYSDEYSSVHRKHSAIRWEKGNVTVSNLGTNPTFVNNTPLTGEQELKNGDEVQFSHNGPRIRFNAKPMKTSTMKFTQRMAMFSEQALRPYRHAVMALSTLLVLTLGLSIFQAFKLSSVDKQLIAQSNNLVEKERELNDTNEKLIDLIKEQELAQKEARAAGEETSTKLAELREREKSLRIKQESLKRDTEKRIEDLNNSSNRASNENVILAQQAEAALAEAKAAKERAIETERKLRTAEEDRRRKEEEARQKQAAEKEKMIKNSGDDSSVTRDIKEPEPQEPPKKDNMAGKEMGLEKMKERIQELKKEDKDNGRKRLSKEKQQELKDLEEKLKALEEELK